MSVLYIALPIAIGLGAAALIACIYCIQNGQYEDLDTPPVRMLIDEPVESKPADETTDSSSELRLNG